VGAREHFFLRLKLRTKLHILRYNIPLHNVDYFILTGTWLDINISDSELGFEKFNVFRVDRSDKTSNHTRGGGVLICVHKWFDAELIKVPIDSFEQLYVMVKYGKRYKFILVTCCIPPSRVSRPINQCIDHTATIEYIYNIYTF